MGLQVARYLPRDNMPTGVFAGLTGMGRGDRNIGALLFTPASSTRYAWFADVMPRAYNASGLTCQIRAHCDSAGDVTWGLAFERHQAGVTDLSLTTNFETEVTGTMAAASGGFQRHVDIALTHAQIGEITNGETFRVQVKCVANGGTVSFMSLLMANAT